jgi:hypothetical protein
MTSGCGGFSLRLSSAVATSHDFGLRRIPDAATIRPRAAA